MPKYFLHDDRLGVAMDDLEGQSECRDAREDPRLYHRYRLTGSLPLLRKRL